MTDRIVRSNLKELVRLLPSLPGVYRFYNKEGTVIYIGKAKNLRNRVSQYFHSKESLSRKTRVMVDKIADLQHTVVGSEEDALLLENNLIKEYQPRYNIMLKDGKTYPWICIKKEPFPRVFTTRRITKDGSLYFGPYSSAMQANNLIELVHSLYYLRDCKLSLTKESISAKKFRPCLKYHIGKCKAPCIGLITNTEYDKQIEQITSLLKGDSSYLIKEFKEKMQTAALHLKYEEAHQFKEKLELLQNHYSKSVVVNQNISNIEVFSLIHDQTGSFGNYFRIVKGSIVHSLNLEFKVPIEEATESVMSRFIAEMHDKFGDTSGEFLVSHIPDSGALIKRSHIPQRGDKHYLLQLSKKNTLLFKRERLKQEEALRPVEYSERLLETIKKDLQMNELPSHIECFDNSNIQGKFAVAACVVFKNGKPSKKDYRHFNIKTVIGANDFASMKEVVNRRYSRMLSENSSLPQLIVIDGGKGQLNFAYEALQELGLQNSIKIIGIAKRLEELVIPGDPHPLFLDKNSPTLKVIMQLRDEAHRFGITHHRKKRSKQQTESQLRKIPGVGEKSEQKLLSKFGSLKRVREASLEELCKIVSKKTASAIIAHFGTVLPK
jgi:excinuclease ABC subunit C